MHLGCYSLDAIQENPAVLYELGGGVLPEIIDSFGRVVPDHPTAAFLGELITDFASAKTLNDNVEIARKYLGNDTAHGICADWLSRSGAMRAIHGSFIDPTVAAPRRVNTLVWSGGTANWMLRRLALTQQIDPDNVGQILLPMGNRRMGAAEHQLVHNYVEEYAALPAEVDFVDRYITPALVAVGFKHVNLVPVNSGNSSEILADLFEHAPELLEPEHQTLVVANSPNAVQAAGQFRLAGRNADTAYDYRGSQLFVRSDFFPIGTEGQPAVEAQNPVSGLGQVLRDFKVLLDNAEFTA